MNFYLTLPSNASSQIYSENNPGHYKVTLPRNIFLPEGDWEVALASISFPENKITCLSSSVRIEHFRDPNLNLWKSTDDLWKIMDIQWTMVVGRYVRFYSYVNWYFSGLDEKIYHTYVDPKRTLFVYTDLTQTQIVGGTETDLLREVSFTNNEKGKYLFEPLRLQYLTIRKNDFDSVEVGISETDGSQVNFKDGQTILTINFRRSGSGPSEMST